MNPSAYSLAWEAYHRYGTPGWAFHEVLAAHLRNGVVISLPDSFLMARRVMRSDPDWFHLSPLESRADGDCWMVWLAAGSMESLSVMAETYPLEWVSYQRRDSMRLRRVKTADIFRHVLSKSPQATAPSSATRGSQWPGASGCGARAAPARRKAV